jgi:hypothetical protein
MSTGVGTLKPARRRSVWPFAVVVTFVMLTVAVIAFSLDRGEPAPAATSKAQAPAVAIASGTAANTPSELRAIEVGTRTGAGISFVRHVPKRLAGEDGSEPSTRPVGATPTELSGGMDAKNDFAGYVRHQRI